MQRRFSPWIVCLLLPAALAASACAGTDAEPVQDGKRLSEWKQQLARGKPEERVRAVAALARLYRKTEEAIPALLAAASDSEQRHVSKTAEKALIALGADAVPVLLEALWSEDRPRRLAAIHVLGRMQGKASTAIPSLRQALEDRDPFIRYQAIGALGNLRARSALPRLVALLKETNITVISRQILASLMAMEVEAERIVPILSAWLREPDEERRLLAIQSLEALGGEAAAAVPDLVRALGDDSKAVQVAAVVCLGRIGPPAKAAVPALAATLKEERWISARPEAAEALWRIARHPDAARSLKSWLRAHHGQPVDRVKAAIRLWWIDKNPEAMTVLVESVRAGELEVRYLALQALLRIGPGAADAVPVLLDLLRAKELYLRYFAITLLGRIGKPAQAACPRLEKTLDDRDGMIRLAAALALHQLDPKRSTVNVVAGTLEDENVEVRRGAVAVLGELGTAERAAITALTKALKDKDGLVRVMAADSLYRLDKSPEAETALLAALGDEEAATRLSAATALGVAPRGKGEAVLAALMARLWDRDAEIRPPVVEALGRIGPAAEKAIPALTALLRGDEDYAVQSAAAEALGLMGPKAREAVPVLLAQLKHPDGYVRVCAAHSLWKIERNRAAVPVVTAGLHFRNPRARVVAAETLGHAGKPDEALRVLLDVLWAASVTEELAGSNVRYMVARALGRLGPAAKQARPQLRQLLYDNETLIRTTARAALQRIDARESTPRRK